MKEYIVKCSNSIDWSLCVEQAIEQCPWSPNVAPAATVQALCLDDGTLLFRLKSCAAPSRAENTLPDSSVWEDSCLECFFSFDGKSYVNLEANSNGALRASFGADRHGRRFLREMGIAMPTAHATVTDAGWEMLFTVPAGTVEALWGYTPAPGVSFRANFYSCGDKTPLPHYAAWNYIDTPTPDFHRPEFFGKLTIK